MVLYNYIREIPDAPNNPSDDQPKMKINTNSIDSLINEDHFSFEQNNGGFHRHARFAFTPPGAIPAGLITDSGTVYVKSAASVTINQNQLFYTNGTSGNEYQLTRVDNAEFAEFGQLNPDPLNILTAFGWTFLPGGLFLQYGTTATLVINGTVNFPFTFPSALFSLQATVVSAITGKRIVVTSQNTSGFSFHTVVTGAATIHWQAIGK
jgi:hypothetical protein